MFVMGVLTVGVTRLTGSQWVATVRFVATPTASNPVAPDAGSSDSGDDSQNVPGKSQAAIYESMVKSEDVLKPALVKAGFQELTPDFQKNISFKPTSSRSYELEVTDSTPDRAGLLANTLAQNLLKKNTSMYTQKAEELVNLRKSQLQTADAELAKWQQKYEVYRAQHGVLSDQTGDMDMAMANLKQAQQQQIDISSKLADAEARLMTAQRELSGIPPTVTVKRVVEPTPQLKQFGDDLAKAESELHNLRAIYTDEKIEVKQAKAKRDELRDAYNAELAKQPSPFVQEPNPDYVAAKRNVATLEQEANGYRATVGTLQGTIGSATATVRNAGGAYGPLGNIGEKIKQATESRNTAFALLSTARNALDSALRQNPLQVVDYVNAVNPPVNGKPGRTKKMLLFSMIAAFLASAGFFVASDALDRRIITIEQAEESLPAPVVAALPHHLDALTPGQLGRVTEFQPKSLSAEAYRFLGLQALHAYEHQNLHSLMVLSARAGQGSTSIVTNLGITLAQAGYRVVVVDANIRTPQIHQVFNLTNEFGFMNLLEQDAGLDRVLHPTSVMNLHVIRTERKRAEAALLMALQQTTVPNLNVITCGVQPENPWELFRSPYLTIIAKCLEEIADFVIYDTPSALAFTDALNLSPVVDGAFLVVRAGETPSGMEQKLLQALEAENVTPLGVILNDVPTPETESFRNYQYYYTPAAPALPERGSTQLAKKGYSGPPLIPVDGGSEEEPSRNTYVIQDAKGNIAS
jgi:Mrp family chromosome partitioning ATPase